VGRFHDLRVEQQLNTHVAHLAQVLETLAAHAERGREVARDERVLRLFAVGGEL